MKSSKISDLRYIPVILILLFTLLYIAKTSLFTNFELSSFVEIRAPGLYTDEPIHVFVESTEYRSLIIPGLLDSVESRDPYICTIIAITRFDRVTSASIIIRGDGGLDLRPSIDLEEVNRKLKATSSYGYAGQIMAGPFQFAAGVPPPPNLQVSIELTGTVSEVTETFKAEKHFRSYRRSGRDNKIYMLWKGI